MEQEPAARRWNRSLGPVTQPGPPRPSETEENEHTRNHHPNHCEGLSANSPIGCPLIPFSARRGSTRFSQGSVTFCYSFLDSCKFSRLVTPPVTAIVPVPVTGRRLAQLKHSEQFVSSGNYHASVTSARIVSVCQNGETFPFSCQTRQPNTAYSSQKTLIFSPNKCTNTRALDKLLTPEFRTSQQFQRRFYLYAEGQCEWQEKARRPRRVVRLSKGHETRTFQTVSLLGAPPSICPAGRGPCLATA